MFDCINHELLIAKLHAYGFSLESLKFVQSCSVSDWIQKVKFNSSLNDYGSVGSGVYISISGPYFFSFVICSLIIKI